MRTYAASLLALFFAAAPLPAADAKKCLDLSARIDNGVSSPSGVLVTVTGRNHCSTDVDGGEARFKVQAIDPDGTVIATQEGRFASPVGPAAHIVTKVFVECEPRRVRSVRVQPA